MVNNKTFRLYNPKELNKVLNFRRKVGIYGSESMFRGQLDNGGIPLCRLQEAREEA